MHKIFLWTIFLLVTGFTFDAQTVRAEGKEQPGAVLEKFQLRTGPPYTGVWDGKNSQIRLVSKTNHIGNYVVKTNDILRRTVIGDASNIKFYSDLEMAEKIVVAQLAALKAAKQRSELAAKNYTVLHQTYKGKNLPQGQYDAVMKRYKAVDDEVANSGTALTVAQSRFDAALANYQKFGGKTDYRAQLR